MFDNNNIVGFTGGNVLRTTNGGINWQVIPAHFTSYPLNFFAYNSQIYFVTLDSTRLMKTLNGGLNWFFQSPLNISNPQLYFTSSNTGFIFGVYNSNTAKLLRTTNGGAAWITSIYDSNYTLRTIFFPNAITGYLAGSGVEPGNPRQIKFFKTTNSGTTWDSVANSIYAKPVGMYFLNENTGYLSCRQPSSLYITNNSGINWTYIGSYALSKLQFFDINNGYSNYTPLSRTTNGGAEWLNVPIVPYIGNHDFNFVDINTGYAAGDSGILLRTENAGQTFTRQQRSVTNIWLEDVAFFNTNTGLACGELGTLLRTTNGGVNWNVARNENNNTYEFSAISAFNNTCYMANFGNSRIFKTTNFGITWDSSDVNVYGATRLQFINETTGFGICKYTYFFKTTNGGQTWVVNSNLGSQNWSLYFINENTGYAGGSSFRKTTDGGVTWNIISIGLYSADIQFINSNSGFVAGDASYPAISKTTDGGVSWQVTYFFDGYNGINDLFFVNQNTGFAASYQYIYKTTNTGNNWFKIDNSIKTEINRLSFTDALTGYGVGQNGTIIKTTDGGGQVIGINPISQIIPKQFSLYQNYPNPFNPSSKFKIQIAKLSVVKVTVFDVLGREVAILVNEVLNPGTYEIDWDGSNYPSGVYFYELRTENFVESKRMVLLK